MTSATRSASTFGPSPLGAAAARAACEKSSGSGEETAHLTIAERFATGYRTVPAGREVYAEGEPSHDLYIVTAGWVFLHQILEDGRRQILDFALPGDWLGFQPQPGMEMTHTAESLTDTTVAVIPRDRLADIFSREPEFALRFVSAAAGALNGAYESLTDVGRRTAREAVAHLLLRLSCRVGARQPAVDDIAFPLTQEHIGDALGLTAVHVCRTLRALREEGVLKLCKATLTILDSERLAEIAGSKADVVVFPVTGRRGADGATRQAGSADGRANSFAAHVAAIRATRGRPQGGRIAG